MKLVTRKLQASDFSRCWPLYFARSRFSDRESHQIGRAWKFLMASRSMQGSLIYDADTPGGEIRAFGASMFMRRDWIEALKKDPCPYSFVQSLINFESIDSPILSEQEIAADNAGAGLTLITAMHGLAPYKPPSLIEVGGSLVSAYQSVHRGFHLREAIGEVYGLRELEFCTQSGSWIEFSRYENFYWRSSEALPAETEQPILMTATRSSCALATPLWCMFDFSAPVLDLSRRQKHVLALAVEGMSNSAIGEALKLRPASVHNCFRGAWAKLSQHPTYQRMIDRPKRATIGNWRRAQLLHVLEHHMEELRPWMTSRRSSHSGERVSVPEPALAF